MRERDSRYSGTAAIDPRLLPDRPFDLWHAPWILAHTLYSNLRDHRKAPPGHPPPAPVFVVGSPRSGTTLLGSALATIPGTTYQFEPVAIKAAVPYIHFGLWDEERARSVVTRTHSMLKTLHGESKRTLIEKTPRNVFIIDRLARWYPDAKFIALIRDGRDVAASWARKPWFASPGENRSRLEPGGYRYGSRPRFWVEPDRIEEFKTTTPEHRCMWAWRVHTQAWLEVRSKLQAGQWTEIRYEQLVTRPEEIAVELAAFLKLDEIGRTALEDALLEADPTSVGVWERSELPSDDRALAEGWHLLGLLGYI